MAYAPVFVGLMLLWPLLAFLGTTGFAPLTALTGAAGLFLVRPALRPRPYVLAFIGLVLWAAVSETWSPAGRSLFTGSLAEGSFAVGARSLIILATAACSVLTIAAIMRVEPSPGQARLLIAIMILHGLTLAGASLFSTALLEAFYGSDPQAQAKGVQNLMRNMNAFMLLLPLLLVLLFRKAGVAGGVLAGGLLAGTLASALMTDNQTAVMTILSGLAGMIIIACLPVSGWRFLLGGIGGYILAAPLLAGLLTRLAPLFEAGLPYSFRSRLWAWEIVLSRIGEAPLFGHGLMASRTWRETYADHPQWLARLPEFWAGYPVIPGHPHNMALQIWAETGLVGALLAGSAFLLLGFRLPSPRLCHPLTRFAGAGSIGAGLMIFSFSYNVWSESFWGGVCLVAASLIFLSRRTENR